MTQDCLAKCNAKIGFSELVHRLVLARQEKPVSIVFTFKTKRFQPTPSELEEEESDYINPGIFARELADFLRDSLRSHGYEIRFRCPEDWGYWQEIQHLGRYTLAIGCSNIDDWDDNPCEHRIFIQPDKPFVRPAKNWFRKIDVRSEVNKLTAAVEKILQNEKQITDVKLSKIAV